MTRVLALPQEASLSLHEHERFFASSCAAAGRSLAQNAEISLDISWRNFLVSSCGSLRSIRSRQPTRGEARASISRAWSAEPGPCLSWQTCPQIRTAPTSCRARSRSACALLGQLARTLRTGGLRYVMQ